MANNRSAQIIITMAEKILGMSPIEFDKDSHTRAREHAARIQERLRSNNLAIANIIKATNMAGDIIQRASGNPLYGSGPMNEILREDWIFLKRWQPKIKQQMLQVNMQQANLGSFDWDEWDTPTDDGIIFALETELSTYPSHGEKDTWRDHCHKITAHDSFGAKTKGEKTILKFECWWENSRYSTSWEPLESAAKARDAMIVYLNSNLCSSNKRTRDFLISRFEEANLGEFAEVVRQKKK